MTRCCQKRERDASGDRCRHCSRWMPRTKEDNMTPGDDEKTVTIPRETMAAVVGLPTDDDQGRRDAADIVRMVARSDEDFRRKAAVYEKFSYEIATAVASSLSLARATVRGYALDAQLTDILVCKRCKGEGTVPHECARCGDVHEDCEADTCPACDGATVEAPTVESARAARALAAQAPSGEPYMGAKLRIYEAHMIAIKHHLVPVTQIPAVLGALLGDE